MTLLNVGLAAIVRTISRMAGEELTGPVRRDRVQEAGIGPDHTPWPVLHADAEEPLLCACRSHMKAEAGNVGGHLFRELPPGS